MTGLLSLVLLSCLKNYHFSKMFSLSPVFFTYKLVYNVYIEYICVFVFLYVYLVAHVALGA